MKKPENLHVQMGAKMKLHFFADPDSEKALLAKRDLEKMYGSVPFEKAQTIVTLGGDGTFLSAMRKIARMHEAGMPFRQVYPMNLGSKGRLLNEYKIENLPERINVTKTEIRTPLIGMCPHGGVDLALIAFNEVYLRRDLTAQSAHIRVSIDGTVVADRVVGDGVICATPMGSTAYYKSAGGIPFPNESNMIGIQTLAAEEAMTKHVMGIDKAGHRTEIILQSLGVERGRTVYACADHNIIEKVERICIKSAPNLSVMVLKDHQR